MSHFTLTNDPVRGPVARVAVAVSQPRMEALRKSGKEPPQAQSVYGLVDTGASVTCIDRQVLDALELSPTGTIDIHTPSSGPDPEEVLQYDVGLMIPGVTTSHHPLLKVTIPVVASELSVQGIGALIGRDVLASCLFVYNGQEGIFTLGF